MKSSSVKAHLADFSRLDDPRPHAGFSQNNSPVDTPLAALGGRSARSLNAYAEGFANGSAETKTAYEALLAQQIEDFKLRLTSERARWSQDEGEKLAELFRDGFHGVHTNVANTTARVVAPFMTQALEQQAARELAGMLEAALLKGADFEMRGPPDLLDAVKQHLPDDKARLTLKPAETCDVEIKVDDSVIETCIGRWVAQIREAMT